MSIGRKTDEEMAQPERNGQKTDAGFVWKSASDREPMRGLKNEDCSGLINGRGVENGPGEVFRPTRLGQKRPDPNSKGQDATQKPISARTCRFDSRSRHRG